MNQVDIRIDHSLANHVGFKDLVIEFGETPFAMTGECGIDDEEPEPETGIQAESSFVAFMRKAVRCVLHERNVENVALDVLVTDDTTIHQTNRDYLSHDYPTDVISFPYFTDDASQKSLCGGDVIVSVDTAIREKEGAPAYVELLLYAIHGTLHITGLTDQHEDSRAKMRSWERRVLEKLQLPQINELGEDWKDREKNDREKSIREKQIRGEVTQ